MIDLRACETTEQGQLFYTGACKILEAVEEAEAAGATEDSDEAAVNSQGPWVLLITSGGMGKRVPVSLFRLQNRAGMGLKALKFRLDEDSLVAVLVVNEDEELMLVTNRGIIIRQRVNDISIQSRSAQGVRLQRLDDDDAIAAVAVVPSELAEDEDEETSEDEAVEVENVIVPDGDVTTVEAQADSAGDTESDA